MADISMQAVNIQHESSDYYGTNAKNVVAAILAACADLAIHSTLEDTEYSYAVYLSYKKHTEWLLKVFSDGPALSVEYHSRGADGEYTNANYESNSHNGALSDPVRVEVTAGSDLALVAIGYPGSTETGMTFLCMRIVDQFTGAEVMAAAISGGATGYYSIGDIYTTDKATHDDVRLSLVQNANGFPRSNTTIAVPAVIYSDDALATVSGRVGGDNLLYYVYRTAARLTFPTRLTQFSIAGSSFRSLGDELCIKIS